MTALVFYFGILGYHITAQLTRPVALAPNKVWQLQMVYIPVVKDITGFIEKNVGENQTVSIYPEGYVFNFYSGRKPAGGTLYNLTLPYIETFGEEKIIEELKKHPADYLILVHNDLWGSYGTKGFCVDYAFDVCKYFDQAYDTVYYKSLGDIPYSIRVKK